MLMRFITIGTILILGFYTHINGKEKYEESLPDSFLGLERFDTSNAYIYSKKGKDLIDAENIINNVADDFKSITGENPKKGIAIIIDPLQKHPLSALLDLFEDNDFFEDQDLPELKKVGEFLDFQSLMSEAKKLGLIGEDLLFMGSASAPIDFKIFKLLVYIDRQKQDQKWSVMELEDFLKKEEITKDVADPWVFFSPSNKLALYIAKKLMPKAMKKELGFFKYLLLKPFIKLLGFDNSIKTTEAAKEATKIELFGLFLDAKDFSKKDKNILEEEYLDKLWGYSDIEENEASHKLYEAEQTNNLDEK